MSANNFSTAARRTGLGTALLLLIPLVAMQFSKEVSWGLGDFAAAAVLLFVSGMVYSLLAPRTRSFNQRVVLGFLVLPVLAAVWAELAVGLFT